MVEPCLRQHRFRTGEIGPDSLHRLFRCRQSCFGDGDLLLGFRIIQPGENLSCFDCVPLIREHFRQSLLNARAQKLCVKDEVLEKSDIHIHVPAGATPKDGPSAGVAMFVALSSLLTSRAVRNDVAMTGEISLRGLVLPIGGVKEKVLAALRAGITTVMLPARNSKELEEIPQEEAFLLELREARDIEHQDAALHNCTYLDNGGPLDQAVKRLRRRSA